MEDELKREAVELDFGGQRRFLRFEFQEIRRMRRRWPADNPMDTFRLAATLKPQGEGMAVICEDEDALARCLWALLARDVPDLTDATVEQWVTDFLLAGGGLAQLADAVWGAFFVGGLGHATLQEFKRKNSQPEAATHQ